MDDDERTRRFYAWQMGEEGTDSAAVVGKGNYGTVFRCGDGAVVKVVDKVRKFSGSAKLAYREHVMSLLQSILVLRGHTPHLPLHYGLEAAHTGPKLLCMRLYLEAFDCSLDAAPEESFARRHDWIALLFQVGSAVLCVAKLLEVCHNDLYPRNVLLRRIMPPGDSRPLRYNQFGVRHALAWHSLAVLTDFGVCSGPLLASKAGPEVKRTPAVLRSVVPFGRQPPGPHVLNYSYLPPYSRDPYMLFKWGAFRAKGLPKAPESVASWCQVVLDYMDRHQTDFSSPDATLATFRFAFSPKTLGREQHSSSFVVADDEEAADSSCSNSFCIASSDRNPVLEDCTTLLSKMPLAAQP